MTGLEAVLLTIITAATPLLLAALGELVTERSGVLNLGVEGMMAIGAVCAFAAALTTGSALLGVLAGIAAGVGMSLLFALLTQVILTNQVATGLALSLFGLGLAGLVGEGFTGLPGVKLENVRVPVLSDLPFIGPLLFAQDPLVYAGFALVAAVRTLARTRVGLVVRAVGANHHSAHALGYDVLMVRIGCIAFGGACAGLAGAYLSLVYTPQWIENMTAGRGWIALALVVFSTWVPLRVLIGAYLFGSVWILGLYAQGVGLGVPSQLLAALPYLVTIAALIAISGNRRLTKGNTPACLGQSFLSER